MKTALLLCIFLCGIQLTRNHRMNTTERSPDGKTYVTNCHGNCTVTAIHKHIHGDIHNHIKLEAESSPDKEDESSPDKRPQTSMAQDINQFAVGTVSTILGGLAVIYIGKLIHGKCQQKRQGTQTDNPPILDLAEYQQPVPQVNQVEIDLETTTL